MKGNQLLIRVSVDRDSLLGKVAAIEKKAEALRFEAMCLREAISCDLDTEDKVIVPNTERSKFDLAPIPGGDVAITRISDNNTELPIEHFPE